MIAHRLQPLVEFDRILVLDSGRLIENDHPAQLLANKHSAFSALYRASEGQTVG
jgi:ABC-type multidrug transport system fused ATPase/permease subunit